ncbi:SIMPL domain-containing protein [Aureimonas endophytica]|uniref:SIMPL domain-containing protein n=1 Tax=Aureimonas endophytica TaxID=2027858 RepID=A0A916ZEW6_9HYPH|nr:SIMPL domain-containing protein [Aureimonas endophytica]GGD92912.1 SIMPL domain-containing protein [Aureimonas endophytica]
MPKRLLPLAALLFVTAVPAFAQEAGAPAPRREVTVSGSGEAHGAPDRATVTFAVQRSGKTAREALDAANQAMTEVVAGMKALVIESRDLQTSGFAITPQYRYDNDGNGNSKPPELVGYEVRNGLTLRLRDVGKVGEVLDRAVTLGVNSGGDVAFEVADPAQLRLAARQDAVRDAAANAKALAEAAGATLGEVLRIEAFDGGPMPPAPMPMLRMAADAAASKAAVPVEAGESTVHADVRVTYALSGR